MCHCLCLCSHQNPAAHGKRLQQRQTSTRKEFYISPMKKINTSLQTNNSSQSKGAHMKVQSRYDVDRQLTRTCSYVEVSEISKKLQFSSFFDHLPCTPGSSFSLSLRRRISRYLPNTVTQTNSICICFSRVWNLKIRPQPIYPHPLNFTKLLKIFRERNFEYFQLVRKVFSCRFAWCSPNTIVWW